ncbi:ATP-binding protein [Mesorhizobium sp. M0134]|uniref:ATP-binding protein n=1 Tax=Mesorhizobium sp. M0134 TaxID=2956889 RepID=UPI003338ED10
MLTHPTLDQMQALGLGGMAAAYRDLADQSNGDNLSRDEWLGLMLDREAAMRADERLTNRLAVARLRFVDACIENIERRASQARPAQYAVAGPRRLAEGA